ncbi:MAG: hypothetical protein JO227_24610 [Acetobacteraceae bacterium]|nr:hypothetical protein [Acetobacteraceae bacterium]
MSGPWPWLTLAGLGGYHGLNPAMGWLFAVALGLHRGSRAVVFWSLIPIALGHALALGVVAAAVIAGGMLQEREPIRFVSGLVLIGWAAYHLLYGYRHRVRIGMRTGALGLAVWSFIMASAHGAGLMAIPALIPLCLTDPAVGPTMGGPPLAALAAVGLHTAAMLAVMGVVAVVVYEWVGLSFLRRGWINLDLIWAAALIVAGVVLVAG